MMGPPLPLGYKVKSPTTPRFINHQHNPAAVTGLKNYFIALARIQFAFFGYLCSLKKQSKRKEKYHKEMFAESACSFVGESLFSHPLSHLLNEKKSTALSFVLH